MKFSVTKKPFSSAEIKDDEDTLSAEEEEYFSSGLSHYAKDKAERECLLKLYLHCSRNAINISNHLIFRFACCNSFDYETAMTALDGNYNHPFLSLKIDDEMIAYMQQLIIYPLPGLKTKHFKSKVIYARSSRYIPAPESPEICNKCFAYMFNSLSLTANDVRNGITILNNLKGYGMKNFQKDPKNTMVKLVDGEILPVKVHQIIAFDAPKVYSKIMKISKPLMTKSFANRIKVVKRSDLGDFFDEGYEQYLPDDIQGGWCQGDEIVEDYIDRRRFVESQEVQ